MNSDKTEMSVPIFTDVVLTDDNVYELTPEQINKNEMSTPIHTHYDMSKDGDIVAISSYELTPEQINKIEMSYIPSNVERNDDTISSSFTSIDIVMDDGTVCPVNSIGKELTPNDIKRIKCDIEVLRFADSETQLYYKAYYTTIPISEWKYNHIEQYCNSGGYMTPSRPVSDVIKQLHEHNLLDIMVEKLLCDKLYGNVANTIMEYFVTVRTENNELRTVMCRLLKQSIAKAIEVNNTNFFDNMQTRLCEVNDIFTNEECKDIINRISQPNYKMFDCITDMSYYSEQQLYILKCIIERCDVLGITAFLSTILTRVYPVNKPVIKGVNVHNKTTTKYEHINSNNGVLSVMQQTIMEYIIRTNPEWIVKHAVNVINTEFWKCKNETMVNIKGIYDNLISSYKTTVSSRTVSVKTIKTYDGSIDSYVDIPNGWWCNKMKSENSRISTHKFNSVDFIIMQIVLMIKYEMAMHSGNVIDVYNIAVKNVSEYVKVNNSLLKLINSCDSLTDEHYEEVNRLSNVLLCANVDNLINKCVSVRYVPIIMRVFNSLELSDTPIDSIVNMVCNQPEIVKSVYKLNREQREQVAVMDIIGREYANSDYIDYTLMTTIVECSNTMNDANTIKMLTDKLAYSVDWTEEKVQLFTAVVRYVKERCPENLTYVTNPRVVRERIERCDVYLNSAMVVAEPPNTTSSSWTLW